MWFHVCFNNTDTLGISWDFTLLSTTDSFCINMKKCWVPHRPVPHVASAQIVLASSCGLKPAGADTTGEEANLTITSAWFWVWGMLDCAPILHSCGMKKNKMIYSIINNKDQERDQEWPKAIWWFRLLWEKNPLWKNWLLVYLDQKKHQP